MSYSSQRTKSRSTPPHPSREAKLKESSGSTILLNNNTYGLRFRKWLISMKPCCSREKHITKDMWCQSFSKSRQPFWFQGKCSWKPSLKEWQNWKCRSDAQKTLLLCSGVESLKRKKSSKKSKNISAPSNSSPSNLSRKEWKSKSQRMNSSKTITTSWRKWQKSWRESAKRALSNGQKPKPRLSISTTQWSTESKKKRDFSAAKWWESNSRRWAKSKLLQRLK